MTRMNNKDRKHLIAKLRLETGASLIIFLTVCIIIFIVVLLSIIYGNPAPGILRRAGIAMIVVLTIDLYLFRKTLLIVLDLIVSQKIPIHYNGDSRSVDKSEFITISELLSKLSKTDHFERIDFNESFRVDVSKFRKEILYVEQFGEVIFPK